MSSNPTAFTLFDDIMLNVLKNYFTDELIFINYSNTSSHAINMDNLIISYTPPTSASGWGTDYTYSMKNVNTVGFVAMEFYLSNGSRLQLNITYYAIKKQFTIAFGREKLNFTYDSNLDPINITGVKDYVKNLFINEIYNHIDGRCKMIHFLFRG